MFENVTYTFYSDTLGRAFVPDEKTFDRLALANKIYMRTLIDDGIVAGERMENGIDTAVCIMSEIDWLTKNGTDSESANVASESINGYSVSYDRTKDQEEARKNAKSVEEKKYFWISSCCLLQKAVL
ncbi:MAG: hypothetical protein IJ717_00930 [Treponema sp.]|nr:hypothetical protein [Treponema sp.]